MSTAFISSTTPILCRASAVKISVDKLTERAATLSWPSTKPPYTVLYSPQGAQFRSRYRVAHPRISLHNLRPGLLHNVQILGEGLDTTHSFTTTASIDPIVQDSDPQVEAPFTELSRLEIRVGKIVQCERHPDADTLYVEKVDVGEDEPRTIVSGLVNYVSLENMIDRNVIVLCNLKPRTMRGITSQGMLLCASNDDHSQVDPLAPPQGAPLGELVTFEGHKAAPIEAGNRATKAFDRVVADLKTTQDGVAKYQDVEFATSKGAVFSPQGLVGVIS